MDGAVEKVGAKAGAKGGDDAPYQKERSPMVQLDELRSQAASTGTGSQPTAERSSVDQASRNEICPHASQEKSAMLSSGDYVKLMKEENLQSRWVGVVLILIKAPPVPPLSMGR